MIDGLFKKRIDPLWEMAARPIARVATANQVTLAGLALVAACCAAFLLHRSPLWFSLSLVLAFSADSMDGAIARIRKESSHFGGYLDAMVDRYQELLVFISLAHFADAWAAACLAFSGAVITSYAKARTAIETPIDNDSWPDFFERQERIIFVCALLICATAYSSTQDTQGQVIEAGLWLLAAITHGTVIQRAMRASKILRAADDIKESEERRRQVPHLEQPPQGHLP